MTIREQIAEYQAQHAKATKDLAYAIAPREREQLEHYRTWLNEQIHRLCVTPASAARMDVGS